MSTEVGLFGVMALVAILSAVFMLLVENAVYSALFLIMNFTTVAFLFLMLNAPFLAMIQIAVYAGAIMVLFLFVIMLLGAEKIGGGSPHKLRWFTPAAIFLAVLFLATAWIGFTSGEIDLTPPAGATPVLRVANVAPDSRNVDIFVDGALLAANVTFRDTTDFAEFEPGEHMLAIAPAGSGVESTIASLPVTLDSDTTSGANAVTVVIYGEGQLPTLGLVSDDLSVINQRRSARLTFFNGIPGQSSVSLVDLGPGDAFNTETVNVTNDEGTTLNDATGTGLEQVVIRDAVKASQVAFGTASAPIVMEEGFYTLGVVAQQVVDTEAYPAPPPGENFAALPGDAQDVSYVASVDMLLHIRDLEISKDSSELILLTGERLFDDSLRLAAVPLVTAAHPEFGGPRAIGEILFTGYLLPFEMVAVLLLAAMMGAIVLTHGEGYQPRGRPQRRKVSRPLTSVITAQTGHELGTPEPQMMAGNGAVEQSEVPEPAGD